jgi:hypothetical protein
VIFLNVHENVVVVEEDYVEDVGGWAGVVEVAVAFVDVYYVSCPEWSWALVEKFNDDEGVVTQAIYECTFECNQRVGRQEKKDTNTNCTVSLTDIQDHTVESNGPAALTTGAVGAIPLLAGGDHAVFGFFKDGLKVNLKWNREDSKYDQDNF